jgi:hypothetical protein
MTMQIEEQAKTNLTRELDVEELFHGRNGLHEDGHVSIAHVSIYGELSHGS